jgi:hypothetical protein
MAADTGDTSWAQGPFGDEVWNVELNEDFVNAATVKEQSAQVRLLEATALRQQSESARSGPAAPVRPLRRRGTLRTLAISLIVAIGAALGVRALSVDGTSGSTGSATHVTRPTGESVNGGSAQAVYPLGTISAETGVPAVAPELPDGSSARPVITMPIAFPKVLRDPSAGLTYTRVGYRAAVGCADPALVSTALAGQIEQDSGCRSFLFALYTDGAGNQYTVADLTLNSADDSFALLNWCAAEVSRVDIGPLTPVPGSGLPVLPQSSAVTQSFAAAGRVLTVGLAQWGKGHTGDVDQLQARLSPLFGQISARAADYEGGNAMVPE